MPSRIRVVNHLPRPVIKVRLSERLKVLFVAIEAFLPQRSHPLVRIDHNIVIWDAIRHTQGIQEGFDGHLGKLLARLLLDDLVQVVKIIPVILETFAGRPACRVGDKVFDLDRIVLEIGRVTGYGLIEAQLPLLDKLHDQRRPNCLAYRGEVKKSVRCCRDFLLEVREPESFGPDDLSILEYDGRHAGDSKERAKVINLFLKTFQSLLPLTGSVAGFPTRQRGWQLSVERHGVE